MTEKLKHSFVKESFEKEGYQLVSEYVNSRTPLRYICPNGHADKIKWGNWRNGSRCPTCSGMKKKTIEFVRDELKKEGYILLSKEYKNNKEKLEYICPNGHKGETTWLMWKHGNRCKDCAVDSRRKSLKEIRSEFEREGYQLLTDNYINSLQKLEYICPNGHKSSTTWGHFRNGKRCPVCQGNKKNTIDIIRNSFDKEGYQLLTTEYKNNKQHLEYVCPNGHRGSMRWDMFQKGNRCPICFHRASKAETEVFELIKSYFNDSIQNDRTVINPLELDIIIPSRRVAVEYCGVYWHSDEKSDKNRHINKLNKCNEKGYRLITIFEDEWIYKRDIVENTLKFILGVSSSVIIYARKCEVREIDNGIKNKFLNKFHIQGADSSSIKLGLYYNNKLISVMTFSKGSIAKGNKSVDGIYELSRFCSDYNYRAIGGAGKLLTHFIKEYKPKQIYSYADRRWSDGNLYKQLGFEFVHNTQPNYWYIIGDRRVHRFNFRKSVLSEKLVDFNPDLTEYENMVNNGYRRIWDCGNSKWIYKI